MFEDLSVKKVSKCNSPRVSIVSESAYAVSEEIDLQKRSNPPHHENKNEEQMETWRAHQSAWVPSRQAGDPETRSSYPSLWGVTEEKNAHAYFTETVPLFPGVVEGTSFAWGLKNKHSAAICHAEKTPEKGIPTLIRHPPAKRTHHYWTTARDRQRAETTRTFFFVEKTRCHEYTYKRRPGVACAFRLAPMASCRGSCRCTSLNGWSWLSFDGLFFFFSNSFLACHSFCASFNWSSLLRKSSYCMFMTRCSTCVCEQWCSIGAFFSIQNGLLVKANTLKKSNLSHSRTVHLWIEWTWSEKARAKFISVERECPGNAGLAS